VHKIAKGLPALMKQQEQFGRDSLMAKERRADEQSIDPIDTLQVTRSFACFPFYFFILFLFCPFASEFMSVFSPVLISRKILESSALPQIACMVA
jgi:hypothetical protein